MTTTMEAEKQLLEECKEDCDWYIKNHPNMSEFTLQSILFTDYSILSQDQIISIIAEVKTQEQ